MSQRSLDFFCACSLLLLACGDSGGDSGGTGGVSASGVTSAGGTVTATTTATTGSESTTGNGGSDSTATSPTTGEPTTGTTAPVDTTGPDTTSTTEPATSDTTSTTTTTGDDTTTSTTVASTTDGTTGECAAVTETATNKKQPADILFVIDNSGSMDMEIASVQANMNQFSAKIIASGIDVHVIVVSDNSICVGAPLGSGNCPADSKPPTYTRINQGVGSNNALQLAVNTYPQYKDKLRPDAATHVVVVTDDNSNMDANTFDAQFKALEPGMADYKMHAICGAKGPSDFLWCIQNAVCCAFTADAGDVYLDLIASTGGKWGDLCLQNFTPVFDELSTQVIMGATLACEWSIPEPMGEPIDFDKVNVEFDDGTPETFGKVPSPAECANVSDGWYYDDEQNPTKIVVCPQTCTKIQGVDDAKINIQFGCETIIAQ
ncbi:vWA domain-containing protein [Nannocystis bainbridge]|uniref:VWA domain-containing protein n=1 Tax=Nannocystis bainbridge TaxID=2995303 RepID=A0ABT5EBN4_9BACT|nr:vWA domain-containing protein [Nannocystis bainbridge]MDC0723280.1 VWA domain-containing protein [Nannocystis bainbridge]